MVPLPLIVPTPLTGRKPVPVKATVSGLVLVLLLTLMLAALIPMVRGTKVTLMVQDNPTPRDEPQLLLWL